jgi:rubrerythrin
MPISPRVFARDFPASAAVFDGMQAEESSHRRRLIELFRETFGDHIPLLRRYDVRGFVHRRPVWLIRPLGLETVRNQASAMEVETRRFYEKAAARAQDARLRQLLDDLALEERTHEDRAEELEKDKLRPDVKHKEDEANRRLFVLQIVQPGLAGLMALSAALQLGLGGILVFITGVLIGSARCHLALTCQHSEGVLATAAFLVNRQAHPSQSSYARAREQY